MRLSLAESNFDEDSADTQQELRVFITYNDLAAGKRAMRVMAGFGKGSGDEIEFQPTPWPFDLLSDDDARAALHLADSRGFADYQYGAGGVAHDVLGDTSESSVPMLPLRWQRTNIIWKTQFKQMPACAGRKLAR